MPEWYPKSRDFYCACKNITLKHTTRSRETDVCLETKSRAREPSSTQPANRPAKPNLDARRRNVNRRSPCTWVPSKSRVSFHLQKCGRGVCHGIECFRSLRSSQPTQRGETIGCPSRSTNGHYAITCLDRSYIHPLLSKFKRYWRTSFL